MLTAGWFIPFVDKRMGGRQNCVIPLTRAIPERIRGGLRRFAISRTVTGTLSAKNYQHGLFVFIVLCVVFFV